jgi:hypothetical protein
MPRKKADTPAKKPVKKKVEEKTESIFDPVERELIMADIALLKQKEIESGDWAKWELSQRGLQYPTRPTRFANSITNIPVTINVTNPAGLDSSNWTYSRSRFIASVGREPVNDDLDRANCTEAGTVGHQSCGWCDMCDKPRFVCGHHLTRRR